MSEIYEQSLDGGPITADQIAKNFEDLHKPLAPREAHVEAARCLYCYDAPCITACPTSIDIPTFIHQIKTGNALGAAETILEANIMGGTCARVCPTEELCEEACVRNTCEDKPVEIGLLQRHAVDSLLAKGGAHPFSRALATGKKIAVVGAGPAGLSAAHRLAMLGHDVDVYDAREKPSGLNEYGIAAYKMTNGFAQAEVDFLLEIGGITLHQGQALGRDVDLASLRADYDAVFIGVGLAKPNRLTMEGADLEGVGNAIDFIAGLRTVEDKASLALAGEDVVVIGGGNTAVDAAIQASRLGADSVVMAYRRGASHMSATDYEQSLAGQNGVTTRTFLSPLSFNGDTKLESITFAKTLIDADGKLQESEKHVTLPASKCLVAIGQSYDDLGMAELTADRGKIVIGDDYQTSEPGVFAGGDCIVGGVDLTVQAVEDGKQAAHAIDTYLKGGSNG